MKFETLYGELLDEMFNTSIKFDPTVIDDKRIEQKFDFYGEDFLMELDRFPIKTLEVDNVWNFGLKNLTQDTYKATHKTERFVGPVFGISANWLNDVIKKYKNVDYILFGSHFNGARESFDQKAFMYKKMADRFVNDKIVRDKEFEEYINNKLKNDDFVVLKVVKKEI